MSSKPRIMLVDDEPVNLEILSLELCDDYDLRCANNGQECLQQIEEFRPQAIILDVSMPQMDGYETCREIKGTEFGRDIAVIFVSARASEDERVAGFEAGGDDYITKPFNPKELNRRLELTLNNQSNALRLSQQAELAQATALEAMTATSELGVIIQFIEQSSQCNNYEDLAQAAINVCKRFGVDCVTQIRFSSGELTISSTGYARPLEVQLLLSHKNKDRVIDFNQQTIFNNGNVSLLISNIPSHDPNRWGRMRDNLSVIANNCNSQSQVIASLLGERRRHQQRKILINKLENELQRIRSIFAAYHDESSMILNEQIISFEACLAQICLEDDQENKLLGIMEKSNDRMMNMLDDKENIEDTLHNIEDIITQATS